VNALAVFLTRMKTTALSDNDLEKIADWVCGRLSISTCIVRPFRPNGGQPRAINGSSRHHSLIVLLKLVAKQFDKLVSG
jgi:hypothetical protein